MSTRYYLDTSALVKLYHRESGTDRVESLFSQADNSLIISELAIVEFYSTVARKLRTGEINPAAYGEVCNNFDDDCEHRFAVAPLSSTVSRGAKELLQKYAMLKSLRSLDALQLAACAEAHEQGALTFVCADTRLLEIAGLEGHALLNPEDLAAT